MNDEATSYQSRAMMIMEENGDGLVTTRLEFDPPIDGINKDSPPSTHTLMYTLFFGVVAPLLSDAMDEVDNQEEVDLAELEEYNDLPA